MGIGGPANAAFRVMGPGGVKGTLTLFQHGVALRAELGVEAVRNEGRDDESEHELMLRGRLAF